jgi:regulator of sirC expression with transglutaminase-like and TPR domain
MALLLDSRTLLTEVLAGPEIDLLRAALAIAVDEYPDLDIEASVAQIDRLADEVRSELPRQGKLEGRLQALSHVLGEVHGFGGNVSDFTDPKNSYLNEVLARKVGIPISLSLVYREVGRRAGVPVHGVAFPGHFLVGASEGNRRVVLDPFHGGKVMNTGELKALLGRCAPGVAFSPEILRAASSKQLLFRMLNNLKHLYMGTGDFARALRVVDLMLVVAPEDPGELRVRASVLRELGAFGAALDDVQHCLLLSPDAPDATMLRWTAQALASRAGWTN